MRFWGWQILPVLVLAVMAVVTVGGPLQSAGVVQAAEARNITVFAAASMKSALDVVAAYYQRTSGNKVVLQQRSGSTTYHTFPYVSSSAPADPGRTHLVPNNSALNPGTDNFAVELRFRTTVPDRHVVQLDQSGAGSIAAVHQQRPQP